MSLEPSRIELGCVGLNSKSYLNQNIYVFVVDPIIVPIPVPRYTTYQAKSLVHRHVFALHLTMRCQKPIDPYLEPDGLPAAKDSTDSTLIDTGVLQGFIWRNSGVFYFNELHCILLVNT